MTVTAVSLPPFMQDYYPATPESKRVVNELIYDQAGTYRLRAEQAHSKGEENQARFWATRAADTLASLWRN